MAKGIAKDDLPRLKAVCEEGLEFARFTLQVFHDIVLKNADYVELITSDTYTHRTYYMGLVDENNRVNFYDGKIRVVDPEGREYAKFAAQQYMDHIAEHVEPWSYVKFCYLKSVGWKGFTEGTDSGIYSVAPLARLNASDAHGDAGGAEGARGILYHPRASRCTTRWPTTGRAWSRWCTRPSACAS